MKSLTVAAILASFLAASATAQDVQATQQEATACRVSPSKPGYFENESLGVTVPERFVFRPGGPGFYRHGWRTWNEGGVDKEEEGSLAGKWEATRWCGAARSSVHIRLRR